MDHHGKSWIISRKSQKKSSSKNIEHHGKSQIPVWDAHGCPIWKHQVLGKYGKITTFCLN